MKDQGDEGPGALLVTYRFFGTIGCPRMERLTLALERPCRTRLAVPGSPKPFVVGFGSVAGEATSGGENTGSRQSWLLIANRAPKLLLPKYLLNCEESEYSRHAL